MTTPPVTTITDELLAELEQLADKATPGPWEWDGREVEEDGYVHIPECSYLVGAICLADNYEGYQDDCDFIAKSNPATILALLQHVRELRADSARLEFMLLNHRKVVIERLPRNKMEIYVEEGFMSDVKYPAVRMTGEWVNDSPAALEFRKKAIDLAISDAARSSTT